MNTQTAIMRKLNYDPQSGIFTWKDGAHRRTDLVGKEAGTVRSGTVGNGGGYRVIGVDGRNYLAHRLAWLFVHGEFPPVGRIVDHINGERDDNRIKNLRLADVRQNGWNRNNIGRPVAKGVRQIKKTGKWSAHIKVFGRQLHLGTFSTESDARTAYATAAERHFGEFARSA
jgi:hypothetical protein